jgi:hypothetical protein
MNSGSNKSPDPYEATRCDMCGQCQESVRPRRVSTVGKNSGTVRTKFCDQCAAVVTKWLEEEDTIELPSEDTITVATEEPLTPAQGEQVTQRLVDGEAERDLARTVEKYEAIEKQLGKRVQVCIADYDETTYNFLHLGAEWTHDFWRMVNYATARKLREVGFLVRFVSLDLDDYMPWLARENLHDSSTARAQFAAAKADWEMGIKSAVPVPISEPRGETPTRQASADMQCDIRRRDRWTRLTKTTAMTVAVVALAAFVGGHNSRAPNHPSDIAVARSPEVRRAIPVEPEIRKAIPVQTREAGTRSANRNRWRSPLRGKAVPRYSATRRATANVHAEKQSIRHSEKRVETTRSANACSPPNLGFFWLAFCSVF